jgi:hypothetical protein
VINTIMTSSRGGGFGLSAEIAAKREAEFSSGAGKQRVREAEAWIEALTGSPLLPPGDLGGSLRDGIRLCELLNACVPGTIPEKRVNRSTMPFKQMENITSFLRACRALGVPEPDLFETVSTAPPAEGAGVGRAAAAGVVSALKRGGENGMYVGVAPVPHARPGVPSSVVVRREPRASGLLSADG